MNMSGEHQDPAALPLGKCGHTYSQEVGWVPVDGNVEHKKLPTKLPKR